ncbi:MAG TPA: imidazole glycerol phosphate synthase subunit HisH [Desulfovibrio sp.]|uniref:imidazole glycerol phosphate synthase subunit HisH n=1 Tax=Desulfovibrio sp. TaxID=885 RepID=UPI002CC02E19|nr:imidazole glycerol phosphate synthase subunit HisH [Desulfovibrio sp.]HMM39180.1 imidazole glycerol phosphate synthase subunit HisH [Desulfovibrio sp.]
MHIRVIPRLDIKGPNLVKGVHLEGLRVLGKPEDFARKYYLDGADELIFIDLVASLYGRSNLKEIVSRTASDIFIPLTVGGGVRSVDDMRELLRAGADKIAINTALFSAPSLLDKGAKVFGSQCMVLYIEAKRMPDGRYFCLHTNARENSGREVVEWVREAVSRGAGEILLTAEDREGTGLGYDLELLRMVNDAVDVPVIASGGAGNLDDLAAGARELGTGAVSAASIFHYHRLSKLTDTARFDSEGNTAFIELARTHTPAFLEGRIHCIEVGDVKRHLNALGFQCRGDLPADAVEPLSGRIPNVAIVDYGMGNLFSLRRAIHHLTGQEPLLTSDPGPIREAERVILPGVGAFGDAMANLRERGLVAALRARAAQDQPLLGICLGMQLLLSRGFEFGEHEGLGIIPGDVRHLFDGERRPDAPVPHIGWAPLRRPEGISWEETPFSGLSDGCHAYFVHTFSARPVNPGHVLSFTEYGPTPFVSAVRKGNVCGCQFHPELSGPDGLGILTDFLTTST